MTEPDPYTNTVRPNRHRDGVPWWAAPVPRRWHSCIWQSTGWVDNMIVERCACGAIRYDAGHRYEVGRPHGRSSWMDKNSRRTYGGTQ